MEYKKEGDKFSDGSIESQNMEENMDFITPSY